MARQMGLLDPAEGPVAAFACRLRALHASAGAPSPRAMERRTEASKSALYAALQGKALPNWATVRALVVECGGHLGAWRLDYEAVREAVAATGAPVPALEPAEVAGSGAAADVAVAPPPAPGPDVLLEQADPFEVGLVSPAGRERWWQRRWFLRVAGGVVAGLAAGGIAIAATHSSSPRPVRAVPVAPSIPPYVPVPISSAIPATSVAEYVAQADQDCRVDQSNALHYQGVLGAATLGLTTAKQVDAVADEIAADVGAPPGNLAVLGGPHASQLRMLVSQYDDGVNDIRAAAPALAAKNLPEVNRLLREAEGLLGEANSSLVSLGATNCM